MQEEFKGAIEFRNVDFSYESRDMRVFDNLELTIKPHTVLGVVGQSGSGKSTLASLLFRLVAALRHLTGARLLTSSKDTCLAVSLRVYGESLSLTSQSHVHFSNRLLVHRLYDVDGGSVLIDGRNVNTLDPQWLRSNIGVVNQDPVLFSGTIAENIAYGRPTASRAEVGMCLSQKLLCTDHIACIICMFWRNRAHDMSLTLHACGGARVQLRLRRRPMRTTLSRSFRVGTRRWSASGARACQVC